MHVERDHQPSVPAPTLSRRVLLALACLLLGAGPAAAATYYVTTGGNDSGAGSQAAPWRTLAKANATLVAGDVCMIAGGTYTDPISPAASGTAGARINYVGSVTNPASVTVGAVSITRAYVGVKGVKSTGGLLLFYTSETAKAWHDSVAYCVFASGATLWGAKDCMVARNTINGPVAMVMNNGYSYVPGTANCAYDTLRGNVISIGTILNKGFQIRGFAQYCLVDSNRVTGFFAAVNGGDLQGRYFYNSYYNTFRDNSWRFEADGPPTGGDEYTGFALRDSSSYNLFERDSMLLGVQSGWPIGGRLVNSGVAEWVGQCTGNRWAGCFFQTTGFVFSQDILREAVLENCVFASNQNTPLWLLNGVKNTTIRNCTFYAWSGPAIRVDGDIRLGGNQIYSNLFCADSVAACYSGRSVITHGYSTGFTQDYNVFYARTATAGVTASGQSIYWGSSACSAPGAGTAWANATGNDTHSKYGAPLLANASWAAFDPHVQAGSAVIGAAQGGGDAGAYPFVTGGGDVTPPAAVTTLTVVQQSNKYALLAWTAPGDNGTSGTVSAYDLRYSTQPITAANFASATAVPTAPAILPAGSAQSYALTGLSASTTYYFALKARDAANNWSALSNVPTAATTATDQVVPASIKDLR
jgi:hypothetical protein